MFSFDTYIRDERADPRETTIMVAMSGGVDSSVAAALLVEGGYRVVGATLKLWCLARDDRGAGSCCSAQSLDDARSVCRTLGIPHYVIDLSAEFERKIVEPFCREYLAGRTPNPCVACNTEIKFGDFLEKAKAMGARFMATGHHVRQGVNSKTGKSWIKKGLDPTKDQSYALWGLTQPVLQHTVFPIGWLTKDQVRERARALSLPVAEKAESQDVCFIPDGDVTKFFEKMAPRIGGLMKRRAGAELDEGPTDAPAGSGPIKDINGNTLGYHKGYYHFTVGQRRGLGVATGRAQYVTRIDPNENVVYVGDDEDLKAPTAYVRDFSFVDWKPPAAAGPSAESPPAESQIRQGLAGATAEQAPAAVLPIGEGPATAPGSGEEPATAPATGEGPAAVSPESNSIVREPLSTVAIPGKTPTGKSLTRRNTIPQGKKLSAKIRYLHPGALGTMELLSESVLRFTFDEPQRAITPGQSLVVYDGEILIGGGVIESAER